MIQYRSAQWRLLALASAHICSQLRATNLSQWRAGVCMAGMYGVHSGSSLILIFVELILIPSYTALGVMYIFNASIL